MKKGSSKSIGNLVNSSTISSLTNGKLKQLQGQQDESNLKLLRELSHIQSNRYCFDCGQRGPTYVNVTIGSFVCMTCSGLLRGLTPPHRVKSISMASFSPEEIELLKNHGNEYCRKVWLATCSSRDSKLGPENDPDRLNNIKAFMSAKYEQKRYYVDPSRLPKGELEQIQQETTRSLQQKQQQTIHNNQKSPSLSSSTHSSDRSPVLNNFFTNNNNNNQNNAQNRMINSITLPDIKPLSTLLGSSSSLNSDLASLNGIGMTQTNNSIPNNCIKNLPPPQINGNHSSRFQQQPWEAASTTSETSSNEFNANFADFDDAFNNFSSNSSFNFNNNNTTNNNLVNGGSSNKIVFPNTESMPIPEQRMSNNNGFGNQLQGLQPLIPANSQSSGFNNNQNGFSNNFNQVMSSNVDASGNSTSSQDKYAALKDLDSLFKTSGGDKETNGMNGSSLSSLPNSTSLPANLSSSVNSNDGGGWLSTSPNANPFSQGSGTQQMNGWQSGVTSNANASSNPHNPFLNPTPSGWHSASLASTPMFNGPTGFPTLTPSQTSLGINGIGSFSSQTSEKTFNPFFITPKPNPNNPFL